MNGMERRPLRVAGALGTLVGLAALWVVSAFTPGVPFPPTAIADVIIRATPGGFATFFIELLQHWALRFLGIGVLLAAVALGAQLLVWSSFGKRLRPWLAGGILAVAALVGTVLGPGSMNPVALVLACAGAGALYALVAGSVHGTITSPAPVSVDPDVPADPSRRRVMELGVGGAFGIATLGGILGWIGRRLGGPDRSVTLVEPAVSATIPDRPDFPEIDGHTPEITSPDDHYVVDINLVQPTVEAEGWTLAVKGEVESPLELTFEELQQRFEVVEEYSVLTCISNEVGGPLVGHSLWGGVRLGDVLDEAGASSNGVDVVFRAADGYTDSIPLELAMTEDVLLAVTQNREPLTQEHGFPCRVRVPPIFGMKNVKWVREIEVVGRDYRGYWMQRGWSDVAVVRTQSRIDVVGDGQRARVGEPTWVAGVAWAGHRGISKVEVSTDGGETWNEADVKEPINDLSWRLWTYRWSPEAGGRARVVCRATDGEGEVQTTRRAPPHPAGATGLHSVDVEVS